MFVSKSNELKLPISCIVLTKNEELAIRNCLQSVQFCEQILVFDSNSSDKTCDYAKEYGAEVIGFTWNKCYPKKKQWALNHPSVRNNWVLMLDADEQISENLKYEIVQKFQSTEISESAFDVQISYSFSNRWLKFGHRVSKRILLDKEVCVFPVLDDLTVLNMWEVEGHYQPIVNGKIGSLNEMLSHHDPDSLYDYFARHNRYSDWEAHVRNNPDDKAKVRNAKSPQGKIFDRMPGKPFIFFVYSYIFKLGFLDGKPGFDYAMALAFYYWQVSLKAAEIRNES